MFIASIKEDEAITVCEVVRVPYVVLGTVRVSLAIVVVGIEVDAVAVVPVKVVDTDFELPDIYVLKEVCVVAVREKTPVSRLVVVVMI